MVLAAAAISIGISVGAPLIVRLYGEQFAPSAPMLAVLIWSEIAIFFGGMFGNALCAAGLERFAVWPMAAGAVLNVGLNIVLIPRWGAMGACWATVISYWGCWTVAFLPFSATHKTLWIGLRRLVPITTIALLLDGALSLVPFSILGRLVLAVVGFSSLACLLGFAQKEDLDLARTIFKTRLGTRAVNEQNA